MDLSTKQLLSSSLLDLARGLKKLRCVVDRTQILTKEDWGTCGVCNYYTDHKSSWKKHIKAEKHLLRTAVAKNSQNSPTVAKNSPTPSEDEQFGDRNSPTPSQDGDPVYTVNGHTPSDWLFHPQNDWKSFPATCAFLFGETLRADRFKNQWVEDVTCVKGWRKISAEHLHDLYEQAWSFGDSVASIVEYAKSQDNFNCDWQDKPDISDAKWLTRSCLWEQDRSEKVWRKWLIGVHNKLPALNLPSVRRV